MNVHTFSRFFRGNWPNWRCERYFKNSGFRWHENRTVLSLSTISSNKQYRKTNIPLPTKYFITTPIYYLNSAPHIGHLYTNVLTDAVSRWYRILGVPVLFSTGTDEHGLKVQQAAMGRGLETKRFCDEMSAQFQNLFKLADIKHTDFIRTTEDRHKKAVNQMWRLLHDRGFIYRGSYEGWYSIPDEAFVGNDQVKDIVNAKGETVKVFVESGHAVEWTKEDNYLFRLSGFSQPLLNWLDKNVIYPDNFLPLVKQWIMEGLPDLSVSRPRSRIPWGIPVPGDDTQTIYVWLDALTNYLTVGGFPSENNEWPVDCHVVGKDILRFHAIYWPAFLMAAGLEPPRKILCHSHWLLNKEKMSKSKGNVVDPFNRMETYTTDGLRYYLLKDGVPHSDGNYNDRRVVECLNSDVVNTLGNLLSRCTAKALNPQQIFPKFDADVFESLSSPDEKEMWKDLYQLPDIIDQHYRSFEINRGLDAIMRQLYRTNGFVQRHKPWELVKTSSEADAVSCIIHVSLETLRVASIGLLPVIPSLAGRILDRLGSRVDERTWSHMTCDNGEERSLERDSGMLFPRLKHSDVN